jgi:hypothetical protein
VIAGPPAIDKIRIFSEREARMQGRDWRWALIGAMALTGCGGGGGEVATDGAGPPAPTGASSVNVFYSGHSLLDDPVGEFTANVATSRGKAVQWNQQIIIGSPLRVRTRGESYEDPTFPGYRTGRNKGTSENLDVVAELRNPTTISGRYDALVLAENHNLSSMLQGEDTVRYARHYHERLIEGNAQGATYLYHAWLGIRDLDNPSDWIAYEKAAAPVWRCAAARVNVSLAAESRGDRLRYLPAGLALAVLVERAMQGRIEGLGGSPRQIVSSLMTDDVHETELGAYFVSLVTFASLYGTTPTGAWAPAGVGEGTKRDMQSLAWEIAAEHLGPAQADLSTCRAHMRDTFCATFDNYVGRPELTPACQARFTSTSAENPFHYDAATDAGWWFPAPP